MSKTNSSQSVADLVKSCQKSGFKCDLFLSAEWPQGISTGSNIASTKNILESSSAVSEAAMALTPKYHFSSGIDTFLEREPYSNNNGNLTRFIGLANFGNVTKERWYYAINIDPNDTTTGSNLHATACPYLNIMKRGLEDESNNFFWEGQRQKKIKGPPPDGYECKICSEPGHWIQDCPNKKKELPDGYVCKICSVAGHFIRDCPQAKKKDKSFKKLGRDLSQCWFCLSNPNLEKHLIVSIGEEIYLAVAKGVNICHSKFKGVVDWGGHLLIVPVGHYQSFKHLANVDPSGSIRDEIQQMQMQVSKLYSKRDQVLVSFELFGGYQGQSAPLQHLHYQLLPIPSELELEIRPSFQQEAENQGFCESNEKDVEFLAMAYCKVEIFKDGKRISSHIFTPSEDKLKEFRSLEEEASQRRRRAPRIIDPQFGRSVIANLLGYPEKSDWKNCIQTEDEEKAMSSYVKSLL